MSAGQEIGQILMAPGIVLTSVMMIILVDFGAERYVEVKHGYKSEQDTQGAVTGANDDPDALRSK